MSFLRRLRGLCATPEPKDAGCWDLLDGRYEIDLTRAPELRQPGGAIRLEGRRTPVPVLVFLGVDGEYHAFLNRCAHAGRRRLDPLPGVPLIRCCSVGKSVYDYTGQVLSGAARGNVEPLLVERDGERLRLSLPAARPSESAG